MIQSLILLQTIINCMNYSSNYFFPNAPHLIKNTKMKDSVLLHKQQIRKYLSGQLAKDTSHLRTKTQNSIGRVVGKPIRQDKAAKSKGDSPKKKGSVSHESVRIFKLLDKVNKLKLEEKEMALNPFYRIQKRRYPNLRKSFNAMHSRMSQQSQQQQRQPVLFKNIGVLNAIEDVGAPQPNEDDNLTYYQMRSYFRQKYGEEVKEQRERRNKSTSEK